MRSALALLLLAPPAAAQGPAVVELGVGAVASLARRDFAGAGVSLGVRPGAQGRLVLFGAGGDRDGRAGLRAEATAQFLLNPVATRGVTLYGAAGIAVLAAPHQRGAGYLTVFLGVEAAAAT
ncbi:MAG: hypothetical protein ACREMJ_07410 [Gemmatimonadales bacterium]